MSDRLLQLHEVAEQRIIPLSRSQLLRAARAGKGPFYKVEGRWMAYESELHAWVRSHKPAASHDPMPDPAPRPRRRGSLRSKLVELERIERRAS